jgi:hypothetical protein
MLLSPNMKAIMKASFKVNVEIFKTIMETQP